MNERIKELEQQCWSHRVDGVLVDGHLHFDTKRFAELIVQKCADIGERYADGNYEVPNQILEYFGMQEEEEE